jgi:hypothetical protein
VSGFRLRQKEQMQPATPAELLGEFDFARPRVVQALRRQAYWKERVAKPVGAAGALLTFFSLVGLVLYLFFGSTGWLPWALPVGSAIGLAAGLVLLFTGSLALTQSHKHRAEAERLVGEHRQLTGERIEP